MKIEINIKISDNEYIAVYPFTDGSIVSYSNTNTSSIITSTNVQGAIDQLFQSVSNGKSQIASAITDKGVSTSSTASFEELKENILKIESGVNISDATATISDILSGKTAYISSGKVTGNITNRGAITKILSLGESYIIPKGYHNGNGKITVNSINNKYNNVYFGNVAFTGLGTTLKVTTNFKATEVYIFPSYGQVNNINSVGSYFLGGSLYSNENNNYCGFIYLVYKYYPDTQYHILGELASNIITVYDTYIEINVPSSVSYQGPLSSLLSQYKILVLE